MEKTYVSRIGTHFMMTGIPGLMKLLTERRSDGMDSASRLERVRRLGANTTSALLALQHCSQPAISSHVGMITEYLPEVVFSVYLI
jgi:hypothetical protein